MNELMNRLNIRDKLLLGFGMVLSILAFVAIMVYINLGRVGDTIDGVVNHTQPAVLDAQSLETALSQANTSLGFYLLSKEAQHREAYEQNLQRTEQLLSQLQSSKVSQGNDEVTQLLNTLQQQINQFKSYREQMMTLAEDNIANQPAFGYAAENINPHGQAMLQLLAQMVLAEQDEDVSEERKELFTYEFLVHLFVSNARAPAAPVRESSIRAIHPLSRASPVDRNHHHMTGRRPWNPGHRQRPVRRQRISGEKGARRRYRTLAT